MKVLLMFDYQIQSIYFSMWNNLSQNSILTEEKSPFDFPIVDTIESVQLDNMVFSFCRIDYAVAHCFLSIFSPIRLWGVRVTLPPLFCMYITWPLSLLLLRSCNTRAVVLRRWIILHRHRRNGKSAERDQAIYIQNKEQHETCYHDHTNE